MPTQPIYCFEHAATQTLVRTRTGELQVLRDGLQVAAVRIHLNSQVSFAGDLALYDSGSGSYLLDLAGVFPQEPKYWARLGRICLHPDGRRILHFAPDRYPLEAGGGKTLPGWLAIDIESNAASSIWHGDTTAPREVYPFGEERTLLFSESKRERWEAVTKPLEFPEIVLSGDGESWALLGTARAEIGRGGERLGSIYWHGFPFYSKRAAFDPAGERLLLSGRPGIVAFDLDGTPAAWWESGETPVTSPVAFWGEDLLAVVQVGEEKAYPPKQLWLEAHRFDPQTLEPRGQLEGMPRRRDAEADATLLPLADGSLAWIPRSGAILVLPAPGSGRRSTEWVQVVGDPLPAAIPHPDADGYEREIGEIGYLPGKLSEVTPGQRRSVARFLLNELIEDGRFGHLIHYDAEAFAPYRDQVTQWSDERLVKLRGMDFRNFWRLVRGASDNAVDRLADRLRSHLPDVNRHRAMLLIGCDTPRAHRHLADLGRRSPEIARLCHDHHLSIPERGPAVRRFSPGMREIIAYNERPTPPEDIVHDQGLEYPIAMEELMDDVRGWRCAAPLTHLLTVPLDLLDGDPLADSPLAFHHWFLTTCKEECDEAILVRYVYRAAGGDGRRVTLIGDLEGSARQPACGGGLPHRDKASRLPPSGATLRHRLALEPYDPDRPRRPRHTHYGRLGGYPIWYQQPEVPDCPECGKLMFYVGQVTAYMVADDSVGGARYGFHCEVCGIGVQVVQVT